MTPLGAGSQPPRQLVDRPLGPVAVYEVQQDGTVVWNLVVDGPNHTYRQPSSSLLQNGAVWHSTLQDDGR